MLAPQIVSPRVRDSRDSRSSRLAEATEKALGTMHFQTVSSVCIWFFPHIYPTFTKSFFKSLVVIIILGPF